MPFGLCFTPLPPGGWAWRLFRARFGVGVSWGRGRGPWGQPVVPCPTQIVFGQPFCPDRLRLIGVS